MPSVAISLLYLHNKLMCTTNQLQLVGVIECLRDVLAERVASSARRDAPACTIIWVRPQQITHRSLDNQKRSTPASSTSPLVINKDKQLSCSCVTYYASLYAKLQGRHGSTGQGQGFKISG